MPRKKALHKYTLYIPKSLDIDLHLKRKPPNFKFKRDKFIYILHILTSINARKKDEDNPFTSLYSPLLKSKIGSNYKSYLQYLTEEGIIESDEKYSTTSHKSKRYKFSAHYEGSDLMGVEINDIITIKNIKTFTDLTNEQDLKVLPVKSEKDYQHLVKHFNDKLTIDFIGAEKYLINLREVEQMEEAILLEKYMTNKGDKIIKKQYDNFKDPQRAYNRRLITVSKIHNKQFETTIDRTSYRFHSPLTQLKKGLRKFVQYDGKNLVSIDVKNCQPYLSTVLFNKNYFNKNEIGKKIEMYNSIDYNKSPIAIYYVSQNVPPEDVKLFISQVTSGQFYEEFIKILETQKLLPNNVTDKRGYAKNVVFRTFFSPIYHEKFSEEIQLFKRIYPTIFDTFTYLKANSNYNTLACVLQRLESDLMIEKICKKIDQKYPYAPLFTIHDSIITDKTHLKKVKNIIENTLLKFVGYKPQLDIEYWE